MRTALDETRNGIVDAKLECLEETNARGEVQARRAAPIRPELALFAPDLAAPLLSKVTASHGNSFKHKGHRQGQAADAQAAAGGDE
eukprot:3199041-Pleurochrysis_carterae.AAC.2